MAFNTRKPRHRIRRSDTIGTAIAAVVALALRVVLTSLAVVVVIGVVVFARLSMGPISLPPVAQFMADRLNAQVESSVVSVGDLVLTLGQGSVPTGLQFRDVTVRTPDGGLLFAVPTIGATFGLADLVQGRVQPQTITMVEPEAQVIRATDGRFRFALGSGVAEDAPLATPGSATSTEDGIEAFSRILAGFVGETAPLPGTEQLRMIRITGARLAYVDRTVARRLRPLTVDLRIWRVGTGARARLTTRSDGASDDTPRLTIDAERRAVDGTTTASLTLEPMALSTMPGLALDAGPLNLDGARLGGAFSTSIDRSGRLGAINGKAQITNAVLNHPPGRTVIETMEIVFEKPRETEHIRVSRLEVETERGAVSGTALIAGGRTSDGVLDTVSAQVQFSQTAFDLPELFDTPLAITRTAGTAVWNRTTESLHVRDAEVVLDGLTLVGSAQIDRIDGSWVAAVRGVARDFGVEDFLSHWPDVAAPKARIWIAENILAGRVTEAIVQARLGLPEPDLSLDFSFEDVEATHVKGLTPLTGVSGRAHMTLDALYAEGVGGVIQPPGQAPVDLAGSRISLLGLREDLPTAVVDARGTGPAESALTVIDQQPLGLLGKIGLSPEGIGGQTRTEVRLAFPLLKGLRLADIEIAAKSSVTDLAANFPLRGGRTVPVTSSRLDLTATARDLRLTGAAGLAGAPFDIVWTESYGGGQGQRSISLKGQSNAALLEALGLNALPINGTPTLDVTLSQATGEPLDIAVDGDLRGTGIKLAGIDWEKPRADPGTLSLRGTLEGGLTVRALDLTMPTLTARGRLETSTEGELSEAVFDTIRIPGRADIAVSMRRDRLGARLITVRGAELDISRRLAGAGGEAQQAVVQPDAPVRTELALQSLRLTDKLTLQDVEGHLTLDPEGGLSGEVEGLLPPAAPIRMALSRADGATTQITVTSTNAGALLAAAGVYRGTEGGDLRFDGSFSPDTGLGGVVLIGDLQVPPTASARPQRNVVGDRAPIEEDAPTPLLFGTIEVPVRISKGVATITDGVALGPALAIKIGGTVDLESRDLDFSGVASPVYGITGAFNALPLLGPLLSGGRGEGLLAMTFTISGTADEPDISVNPVSILAPGFLRKIFTTDRGEVSEDFIERLQDRRGE